MKQQIETPNEWDGYARADVVRLAEIDTELKTASDERRIELHAERYEIHSRYVGLNHKIKTREMKPKGD